MLRTALAGGGITFAPEETFLPPFPGLFLYFPQRRNMAPKLRALLEHVKQFRTLDQ